MWLLIKCNCSAHWIYLLKRFSLQMETIELHEKKSEDTDRLGGFGRAKIYSKRTCIRISGIHSAHQSETKSKMDSNFHSNQTCERRNFLLLIHNSFCCFNSPKKIISELKIFRVLACVFEAIIFGRWKKSFWNSSCFGFARLRTIWESCGLRKRLLMGSPSMPIYDRFWGLREFFLSHDYVFWSVK